MYYYRIHQLFITVLFSTIIIGGGICPVIGYQESPSNIEETDITEEMDILDTGPIHEAFAESSTSDTEPGIVVPKAPPDPIEEIPPKQEDLDEDAEWISGYWAWDDERNDYIWISGTWRVPPLGRHWVAGYWAEVGHGYQWISGYWADNQVAENEYLPKPPESLDEGPNCEAPSPDYVWIPGCWTWAHRYYVWRPGYWAELRPDRIWIPAYYVWTPMGYIFAGGYWDYPIIRRGVLFAPVYFYPRFFTHAFIPFTPRFVISVNVFTNHLFLRLHYRHYYFGNYYAPKYSRRGIYHVSSMYQIKHRHDPIYTHQRYTHQRISHSGKDVPVTYQKQMMYKNEQQQKVVKAKKKREAQHKTVVQNNKNMLPSKNKNKNKGNPQQVTKMKKNKRQETITQKMDTQGQKKKPKRFYTSTEASTSRRVAPKPKTVVKDKSLEKPVTDKAIRNTNKSQSLRIKYKEPQGNPEEDGVAETPNNPNFNGRDRQRGYDSGEGQVYNGRGKRVLSQDREDRGTDPGNHWNQRITKAKQNPDSQREYLGRSRQDSNNQRRIFNSRR